MLSKVSFNNYNLPVNKMSHQVELPIKEKYSIIEQIGRGAYGHVFRTINKKNNEICVLKKIFQAFRNIDDSKKTFREINNLMAMRHPNIVGMRNFYFSEEENDLYVQFENMQCDLSSAIKQEIINTQDIPIIFSQLASAIFYLHSANILHRDIKSSNVLISKKMEAKICDFGHSRTVHRHSKPLSDDVGTFWFKAPELLLNSQFYGKEVDIWGLGCILAEMYKGGPLFKGEYVLSQLSKILEVTGEPNQNQLKNLVGRRYFDFLKNTVDNKKKNLKDLIPNLDPLAQNLLESIFQFDPKRRPTIQDIINHPFVLQASDYLSLKTKRPSYFSQNYDSHFTTEDYKKLILKMKNQISEQENKIKKRDRVRNLTPLKNQINFESHMTFSPQCKFRYCSNERENQDQGIKMENQNQTFACLTPNRHSVAALNQHELEKKKKIQKLLRHPSQRPSTLYLKNDRVKSSVKKSVILPEKNVENQEEQLPHFLIIPAKNSFTSTPCSPNRKNRTPNFIKEKKMKTEVKDSFQKLMNEEKTGVKLIKKSMESTENESVSPSEKKKHNNTQLKTEKSPLKLKKYVPSFLAQKNRYP